MDTLWQTAAVVANSTTRSDNDRHGDNEEMKWEVRFKKVILNEIVSGGTTRLAHGFIKAVFQSAKKSEQTENSAKVHTQFKHNQTKSRKSWGKKKLKFFHFLGGFFLAENLIANQILF